MPFIVTYVIPNSPHHEGVGRVSCDTRAAAERVAKKQAEMGRYEIKIEEVSA